MRGATVHYVARFSDGWLAEIKKSTRRYTHAWRVTGTWKDGKPWAEVGFAGSLDLANKAAHTVSKRHARTDLNPEFFPGTTTALYVVELPVTP